MPKITKHGGASYAGEPEPVIEIVGPIEVIEESAPVKKAQPAKAAKRAESQVSRTESDKT